MKNRNVSVSSSVYSRDHYRSAAALLAVVVGASAVSAQTLTKANNTTTLNLAGSWVENSTPVSSSTLLFNSTVGAGVNAGIGASLTINGIQVTNVSGNNSRISPTGSSTLTLGSGGVDMSTASGNLRIDPAIILSANQTWSVASGRILNLVAAGISGSFTAQATGAGTLAFDAAGSGTYGSQLEVDVTTLRVNFGSTNVTLTNANNSFTTLNIFNGQANFSSIANSGQDSAAGAFATGTLGGNATNGVFVYTGNTASTNRAFTVDRRSAASGILVGTAGQTLTISGSISHNAGNATSVNNAFRVGGEGNLTLSGVIGDSTEAGFTTALAKEGAGTLTLSNANTFQGGVDVAAGTLLVENTTGSGTGSGAVGVSSGAALGGDGIISGNVTFNSGAKFVFSVSSTLDVSGTTTLPTTFGVDDLVGLTSSVAINSYLLIGGSGSISYTSIENLGVANAFDLGGGKSAYFDLAGDNLSVVVAASAIPEPSSFAVLAGLGALGFSASRRRRRTA